MKSELITKLNTEIAMIDSTAIKAHMEQGDLDEWLDDWRMEISATSFGLYALLYELAKLAGIGGKK